MKTELPNKFFSQDDFYQLHFSIPTVSRLINSCSWNHFLLALWLAWLKCPSPLNNLCVLFPPLLCSKRFPWLPVISIQSLVFHNWVVLAKPNSGLKSSQKTEAVSSPTIPPQGILSLWSQHTKLILSWAC